MTRAIVSLAATSSGIGILHGFHNFSGHSVDKRFVDPKPFAMHHGAPHDFAQHIAALIVSGILTVADHKGCCAGMIGNDSHGDIVVGIGSVIGVADVGYFIEEEVGKDPCRNWRFCSAEWW